MTSVATYRMILISAMLLQAERGAQDDACQQERSLRQTAEADSAALRIQLAQEKARRLAAEEKVWPHLTTCLLPPGILSCDNRAL